MHNDNFYYCKRPGKLNCFLMSIICLLTAVLITPALVHASESQMLKTSTSNMNLSDTTLQDLVAEACQIYKRQFGDITPSNEPLSTITAKDMTIAQKSFMTYWYQYNMYDYRIRSEGEYNVVSASNLAEIIEELFESDSASVFADFTSDPMYVYKSDNDIYMYASGDFGDGGGYYFSPTQSFVNGDYAYILGDVYIYNSTNGEYRPLTYFRVDCSYEGGTAMEGWKFVQVFVASNKMSLTPS